MSVLASWQSHVSGNTGRVCAWFSTSGTMGLRINGAEFIGSDTNDGNVAYCDFSLPSADIFSEAEITLDGVMQKIQWTHKSSTDSRPVWTEAVDREFRAIWLSCSNPYREVAKTAYWVNRLSPNLVIWLGDTMYHEPNNLTNYGVTRNNPEGGYNAAVSEADDAWNAQRMFLLKPSVQMISSMCPIIYQFDDHELMSDFRNDLTGMQAQFAFIDTQEKLDAIKLARVKLAVGTLHPWAASADGQYYRVVDYGPVRFIVPDLVSESGARLGTTKMSSTQLSWYKSKLHTDKPFVIGAHTKTATDGNADSWYYWGGLSGVGSQLKDILDYIESNQISTWGVITGDLHHPNVQYNENPQSLGSPTDFSPYLGVCSCAENQFDSSAPTTSDIIWKKQGKAIGYLRIPLTSDYVEYTVLGLTRPLWRGRQNAGSNKLVYTNNVSL